MILGLTTATDETLTQLMACPQWVWFVLADREEAIDLLEASGCKPEDLPSLPPEDFGHGPGERVVTDLDKAWHGIHFLLTGSACEGESPWCYLLRGGQYVGDVDVGYGAARALSAAEVRDWANALATLPVSDFRARFDAERMVANDIYPDFRDRAPEDDDTLGYLEEYYSVLREYVVAASQNGMGLLIDMR